MHPASDAHSAPSSVKLTKADEDRYGKLYQKGWRTIRRWIEKGEKSGIPCPLHDPRALMAWWPSHFTWRVPPEVEQAALDASRQPTAPAPSAERSMEQSGSMPTVRVPDPGIVVKPPGKSIDIESFDPEEGDRLRELKQIQAAKFSQLKDALKAGDDATALETKYVKLCETIDKIETRVTERLKKRGLYILREAVERDLAAAAELLRQSRESMDRRVQELCPSLDMQQRLEVTAAITKARRAEERILSMLPSLHQNDLLRELAA